MTISTPARAGFAAIIGPLTSKPCRTVQNLARLHASAEFVLQAWIKEPERFRLNRSRRARDYAHSRTGRI